MSSPAERDEALESSAPLDHEPELWYIEVGIDYGTSSIKITARLRHEGDENTPLQPAVSLEFSEGAREIPAWIALYEGAFHCGFDLSYRLSDACPSEHRVPRGLVLRCLKLHLYEDYAEQNAASVFSDARKFGGKSADDFVVEQFRYIITQVRQFVASSDMVSHIPRDKLQQLPLRARLSQPEIFTPTGCHRLQSAAREAGIEMAVCASEPQCLLAQYMDGVAGRSRFPSTLEAGDFMTIADFGCGTGDFSTFLLKSKLNMEMRLDAVQKKTGALCGAEQVNRNILASIQEQFDLAQKANQLGVPIEDLIFQLNEEVETAKKNFQYALRKKITAYGEHGAEFVYTLTKQELDRAQEQPVTEIISKLDELFKEHKPKILLLAGGFKRSEFLQQRLRDRYEARGISIISCTNGDSRAVAQGALSSRYSTIDVQDLPVDFGYAVLQDEEVNPVLHPDAYDEGEKNPSRVAPSPWHQEIDQVIDRIRLIIPKGDSHKSAISRKFDADYRLLVEEPVLEETFVYLTRKFQDHEPALVWSHDPKKEDNKYRPGVRVWRVFKILFTKAELSGVEKFVDGEDEERYLLRSEVTMEYQSANNFDVKWRFKKPDGTSFVKEGTMWEAKFSEFSADASGDQAIIDQDEQEYAKISFLDDQQQATALAEQKAAEDAAADAVDPDDPENDPDYMETESDNAGDSDEAMSDSD